MPFTLRLTLTGLVNVHFQDEQSSPPSTRRFDSATVRMIRSRPADHSPPWNLMPHRPLLTVQARDLREGTELDESQSVLSADASGTEIVTIPLDGQSVAFEQTTTASSHYTTSTHGSGAIDAIVELADFDLTAPTYHFTACTVTNLPRGTFESGVPIKQRRGPHAPIRFRFRPRNGSREFSNDLVLRSMIQGNGNLVVDVGGDHHLVLGPVGGRSTLEMALANLPTSLGTIDRNSNNVDHLIWWAQWAEDSAAFKDRIALPMPDSDAETVTDPVTVQGKICPATRQMG